MCSCDQLRKLGRMSLEPCFSKHVILTFLTVDLSTFSLFYMSKIFGQILVAFDFNDILQNIFLYAEQKKETHTGLERHEGDWMMLKFSFLG